MLSSIKKNIKNLARKTISFVAKIFRIDLLRLAYNEMGILNHKDQKMSGEDYFVESILSKLIKKDDPILFDVGANNGEYSSLLRKVFPKSHIYAFEPNKTALEKISKIVEEKKLKLFPIGLSSSNKKQEIFVDPNNSQVTTLYKKVLTEIHNNSFINSLEIETERLDDFCKNNFINHIDFLKIDTEGHELEILKGASELLKEKKIDVIQFEFNEMNIVSRVFLKDFYDILSGFNFYRLFKNKPIALGSYQSNYEIFKFQNIIAVSKEIDFPNNNVKSF